MSPVSPVSLLLACLTAFVLLVPMLMVAVLASGLSRRTSGTATAHPVDVAEPTEVGVAA